MNVIILPVIRRREPAIEPPATANEPMEVTTEETMETEECVEGEWAPDPNEPRYCLCNQVSYGDMVACDNPEVSAFCYLFITSSPILYVDFCLAVPSRVVPLRLRRYNSSSKREMVLPSLRYFNEAAKGKKAVKHVDCLKGQSVLLGISVLKRCICWWNARCLTGPNRGGMYRQDKESECKQKRRLLHQVVDCCEILATQYQFGLL